MFWGVAQVGMVRTFGARERGTAIGTEDGKLLIGEGRGTTKDTKVRGIERLKAQTSRKGDGIWRLGGE